jgi:thiamine-monophosphate kinase
MGATPVAFTLALTLPTGTSDWLEAFARGLNLMAQNCRVALVGGDTTRGPLSLTMTVFGRVPTGLALTRSGAQPGDLLCVGGDLGNGAGALPLVLGQRTADAAIADPLLAHYWSPQPQLALGQALRGKATAALDISDGLLADCGHIALASKVGIEVERSRLPLSKALLAFLGQSGAEQAALSGGDDYVLAFTLPPAELPSLLADGWPIHVLGQVVAGQGVILLDADGHDITPPIRGYQHFRETP